ncbi:MAG: carboxymuconolactone decarboxylase [Hyphomicrobiales bacterium]|nr:carboxymuconolactone decarboxylase [Hyphomicrobiales bacterium]
MGKQDWPADIDPQSGFRLPLLKRDELDEAGQRRYDRAVGGENIAGLQGPTGIMLYSPKTSEAQSSVTRYLRNESGIPPRVREIALLITSRCMDQQFEWTAHEPVAVKAGVPRETIDAIKFDGATAALDATDALVIELGRAVWRDHKVSPELFARARAAFEPHMLVDLVLIMGTHASTAALLTAFNMQLHDGVEPMLPIA